MHIADQIEQASIRVRHMEQALRGLYERFDLADEQGNDYEMQQLSPIVGHAEEELYAAEVHLELLKQQAARETAEVRAMSDDYDY